MPLFRSVRLSVHPRFIFVPLFRSVRLSVHPRFIFHNYFRFTCPRFSHRVLTRSRVNSLRNPPDESRNPLFRTRSRAARNDFVWTSPKYPSPTALIRLPERHRRRHRSDAAPLERAEFQDDKIDDKAQYAGARGACQKTHGLAVDGRPSAALLESRAAAKTPASRTNPSATRN